MMGGRRLSASRVIGVSSGHLVASIDGFRELCSRYRAGLGEAAIKAGRR